VSAGRRREKILRLPLTAWQQMGKKKMTENMICSYRFARGPTNCAKTFFVQNFPLRIPVSDSQQWNPSKTAAVSHVTEFKFPVFCFECGDRLFAAKRQGPRLIIRSQMNQMLPTQGHLDAENQSD
jgi:hypothetical protein